MRAPTELGYLSMLMLADILAGKPIKRDTVLPTCLVVRSTTGPPPSECA